MPKYAEIANTLNTLRLFSSRMVEICRLKQRGIAKFCLLGGAGSWHEEKQGVLI